MLAVLLVLVALVDPATSVREVTPAGAVAAYAASWARDDTAVRATITGPETDDLVRRIAVIRPHLVADPAFLVDEATEEGAAGVIVLPVARDAELHLPITAVVEEGRVRADPSALARPLRAWPEVAFDSHYETPGRLLDREGAPLDPDRDASLLATLGPVFTERLGGGWSYRLTGDGDVLAAREVPPAADVRLALDPEVQAAAAAAVGGGERRALVAVDASTGQVVAFAGGSVDGRALGATASPVGSVFKIATATAALLTGRMPEDTVRCPAADIVEGRAVANASNLELGELSLRRAFALSCNTTFSRLGADLGGTRVHDAAVALGFTARLSGTEAGRVDEPGSGEEAAALGFGASGADATPVALASVAATLADGGVRRAPTWEAGDAPGRQVVRRSVAEALVAMMRDAVENGTAQRAGVPGVDVAAKTGTPRRIVGGVAVDDGLTVAVVRGDGRVLGIAAVVLEGGAGGRSAAPLIADFVRRLLPA